MIIDNSYKTNLFGIVKSFSGYEIKIEKNKAILSIGHKPTGNVENVREHGYISHHTLNGKLNVSHALNGVIPTKISKNLAWNVYESGLLIDKTLKEQGIIPAIQLALALKKLNIKLQNWKKQTLEQLENGKNPINTIQTLESGHMNAKSESRKIIKFGRYYNSTHCIFIDTGEKRKGHLYNNVLCLDMA